MSELEDLMNLDPLELSSQDIDKIIMYQRKARQNFKAGIKPKREKAGIDLSSVIASLAPTKAPDLTKRRR